MAKKKKPGKVIQMPQNPETQVRTRARKLELGDCYINSNWEEIAEATILVTRKHKQGGCTFGVFLVDMAMEGLKDTFYTFNMPTGEFKNFLNDYRSKAEHEKAEYTLVHNIVYGAIEFGEENGFREPKDFTVSQYILEEDNDDIPLWDIPYSWGDDSDLTATGHLSYESRLCAYADLVSSLPDITEQDISSEYIDEEEFDDLIDEWEIEDWTRYFTENSKNISIQYLDFMVIFAWEFFDEILDLDHYEMQFNRKWIRRQTRHKKLDEMNQMANEAILAGNFVEVPKIYNDCDAFRDLFPKSKIVPIISVIEMCRIYCEYYINKLDFSEALHYYTVIQILVWNNYPDEVIATGKKLMASAIQEIKVRNQSSRIYPEKKD